MPDTDHPVPIGVACVDHPQRTPMALEVTTPVGTVVYPQAYYRIDTTTGCLRIFNARARTVKVYPIGQWRSFRAFATTIGDTRH